ncbi:MAG: hypothetical protein ACI83W_002128 [Marinoscillum sp.]|jgi:hypothetical protein
MNFKAEISKFRGEEAKVYQLHIPIPEEVSHLLKEQKISRVKCLINKQVTIQSGIMNAQHYNFILLYSQLIKTYQLQLGDEVSVSISEDKSEYGMPFPDELEQVFLSDTIAFNFFKSLTSGKQRNLIYIVNNVKSQQSRITKSLAIADHLNMMEGKLNFKLLNELIKQYNHEKN